MFTKVSHQEINILGNVFFFSFIGTWDNKYLRYSSNNPESGWEGTICKKKFIWAHFILSDLKQWKLWIIDFEHRQNHRMVWKFDLNRKQFSKPYFMISRCSGSFISLWKFPDKPNCFTMWLTIWMWSSSLALIFSGPNFGGSWVWMQPDVRSQIWLIIWRYGALSLALLLTVFELKHLLVNKDGTMLFIVRFSLGSLLWISGNKVVWFVVCVASSLPVRETHWTFFS